MSSRMKSWIICENDNHEALQKLEYHRSEQYGDGEMDRMTRKGEIRRAFIKIEHLMSEKDKGAYSTMLSSIGIQTDMELGILCSVLQDEIMEAVRAERPTALLRSFLAWLMEKRIHTVRGEEYEEL